MLTVLIALLLIAATIATWLVATDRVSSYGALLQAVFYRPPPRPPCRT